MDKCEIAKTATEYLEKGEDRWTKRYLLVDENGEFSTSSETRAERILKAHPDREFPMCMLGSIVYACVKHGVPVADTDNDRWLEPTYREIVSSLDETVYEGTDHQSAETVSFNDDPNVYYEDVINMMHKWQQKVCQ